MAGRHLLDDKQKVDTFGCVTMVAKRLESPALVDPKQQTALLR